MARHLVAVADTIYTYEEMRERYSMRKREREREVSMR